MADYVYCVNSSRGVRIRISAGDQTELCNAATSALCLYMSGTEVAVECERIAVARLGLHAKTALVGLLSELLFCMETDAPGLQAL